MVEEYHETRKYFELIEKVGSWHRYQFYVLFMLSGIGIYNMAFILMTPFIFHQSQYECPSVQSEECRQSVCALPPFERVKFQGISSYSSLADSLGNFRCEQQGQLLSIQSIMFIASIAGMLVFTLFAEAIGRKNSLLLTSISTFLGFILIYFTQSIEMLIVGIIITVFGNTNGDQIGNCLPTEIVMQVKRIRYMNIIKVLASIGLIMNSLIFDPFSDWKTPFLIFYIIPSFFILLAVIFVLQKTPMELLKSQAPENILKTLVRIKKMNGVQDLNLSLEYVSDLQREYFEQSLKNHEIYYSIMDLFRYKSILFVMIPICGTTFSGLYLFSTPAMLDSSATSEVISDNIFLSGLSFIVSIVLIELVAHRFDRKTLLSFSLGVAICITALMLLQVVKDSNTLSIVLFMIYRLVISMFMMLNNIICYQSFPTQVRAVAGLFVVSFGMTSGIIQPWVINFYNIHSYDVKHSFIVIALLGLFSVYFVKETSNIPPPQVIKQLELNTQISQASKSLRSSLIFYT